MRICKSPSNPCHGICTDNDEYEDSDGGFVVEDIEVEPDQYPNYEVVAATTTSTTQKNQVSTVDGMQPPMGDYQMGNGVQSAPLHPWE